MKKNLLLIIDSHALIHRAYHAFPPLSNSKGLQLNAVYGFTLMLLKTISQFDPEYVVCTSDLPGGTFRKEKVESYKANRAELEENLINQIDVAKNVASTLNIPILEKKGYEADDIIGTVVKKLSKDTTDILIITGDRDLLQLINPHTRVVLPGKSFSDTRIYSAKEFEQRFGFSHESYVDFKALVGDASDNIIGVKGIGDKTASDLVRKYGNVDGILKNLDKEKSRTQTLLGDAKEKLEENKFLAKIECDVPIDFDLEKCKLHDFDYDKAVNLFHEYEFKSLLKLIPRPEGYKEEQSLQSSMFDIPKTDMTLKKAFNGHELAIAVIDGKVHAYDPDKKEKFIYDNDPQTLLESKRLHKIGANFKGSKIPFSMPYDDVQLMQYCLDSRYKVTATDPEEIFNVYKNLNWQLKEKEKIDKIYSKIEIPLERILLDVERNGICVDKSALERLGKIYEKKIIEIKKKIFETIGHEFNPASTKDLGHILFEELGLSKGKKNKTGYSTDDKVLDKIKNEHPVVEMIRDFREYSKLKSTYIEGLVKLIGEDGKIHTEYNQVTAATGRLSSINPNLQNLPIKSDHDIREAFLADTGCKLISFDYSQIELRLMAHIAKEKALIKAFNEGEDIHAATAALIFNKDIKDVSKNDRNFAKTVNFGILYGMGEYGLSQRSELNMKDAKKFIEEYWAKLPSIKKYIEYTTEQAKTKGYVETMFGRRRYFDFTHAPYLVQQAMIREAVNMPIQGTQADIIKIAMINVYKDMDKYDAKMLLQIHDELVFEIKNDPQKIKEFIDYVTDKMSSVIVLDVPLLVEHRVGDNLAELK